MSQSGISRLLVEIGATKIGKHATRESGDTLEIIERPHGGVSVVLVDGQRSGRAAKIISNIVARKAISLLGEGVRDGAAARATHDYLRTHRRGKVSAELQMLSVDLVTNTLVVSRNSRCPAYVISQGHLEVLDAETVPIGIYADTKPVIREIAIAPGTYVVMHTDGVTHALEKCDERATVADMLREAGPDTCSAQELADRLFRRALICEGERPRDDVSLFVLAVREVANADKARRLSASWPVNGCC